MPFNGSGVFNRVYNWVTDRNNGINILASRVDTEDDGFASGLTLCMTKDGQSTPTADIGFGGFKVKNVGNATLASDAPNVGQIQGGLLIYYADTGVADAYAITPSPAVGSYVAGQSWQVKISHANLTTTPTLNVNGLGAKTIKLSDGTATPIGILALNSIIQVTYDGTSMLLVNTTGSATSVTSLTGDVTGTGPGATATTIAALAVTTGKIAAGAVTEAKITLADNTTGNVSTSAHGFAPKGDGVTTKFLNANGAYSTPVGISGDTQTFTSSGTWTKPAIGTFVHIEAWGAGGGGGANSSTAGTVGGGGGGSYKDRWVAIASLGGTETVTIGAAGTGGSSSSGSTQNGVNGGNTTFGSFLTAQGGTGGTATTVGGPGGGWLATATVGTATNDTNGEGTGGSAAIGGIGFFVGGGGASGTTSSAFAGGSSVWGGGGGGSPTGAAGTSQFGGNGSAGANSGSAANGTQPGGGGGGVGIANSSNAAGAGAKGKVIVTVY